MDRQIDIPKVSNSQEINGDGGIVTIIVTDPLKYKKSTRSVKKTLTIPEWLNEEAEKNILIFHRFYNKLLSH